MLEHRQGVGQRIRDVRMEKDFSLRELARRIEVSAPFLSDIELGHRHSTPARLAQIAAILGVELAELTGQTQIKEGMTMPAKPKATEEPAVEELTVFEAIKNRIAERSEVIAGLRMQLAELTTESTDKDALVTQAATDVDNMRTQRESAYDAQRAAEGLRDAAVAANAELQAFLGNLKALPEFADLFMDNLNAKLPDSEPEAVTDVSEAA